MSYHRTEPPGGREVVADEPKKLGVGYGLDVDTGQPLIALFLSGQTFSLSVDRAKEFAEAIQKCAHEAEAYYERSTP